MDIQTSTRLEEALDVLCLECTKYDASDQLAKLLAIVSLTPYLAILHVASVSASIALSVRQSPSTSGQMWLSKCCAFLRFIAAYSIQVIYSRRQLHDAWTVIGMVICAAVAKFLKAVIRHSRC